MAHGHRRRDRRAEGLVRAVRRRLGSALASLHRARRSAKRRRSPGARFSNLRPDLHPRQLAADLVTRDNKGPARGSMQRGASLGRAMVSLATRGAPAHLARARSGATATTSSLTRASSHNGARHHAAWSLQPSHPTPRPPHRATRGRPSSPPVVARSSTTDSTSTSAIKGDRVTLPPPGDVHLWIMDPADAADPALCRDYRERCLPASERDALESEAANMTEGALRQATHSKALMRWVLARYCGGGVAPADLRFCLLYTSPSPRDLSTSRMPSSA